MCWALLVSILVSSSFEYVTAHETKQAENNNLEEYRKRLYETHTHVTSGNPKQVCDDHNPQESFIKSPGYPENYSENLSCNYKIELETNNQIQLMFRDVKLQKPDENGDCLDYVEVYDGHASWDKRLKIFCGDGEGVVHEPIISTSNKLRIKFVTDDKYTDKGFFLTYDPYKPPKETDMTQKVTGVVIGTACGLVFLILSFLAVCHSRRLHVLRRRDARRYEISSTSGPDVVEEGAPPSYDAVMSSPEKYPLTPSGHKDTRQILDVLPPYPGLVLASGSGNDRRNNPRYVIQFHTSSQAISTDV